MKKRSLVICLASFVAGCGKNNHEIPKAERITSIKEPVASKPKNQPTVLKPEPEPSALLAAWEKAGLSREEVAVWEKAGFQSGWMRLQNDLAVSFSSSLDGADASRAVPGFAYRAYTQSFGAFVAVEKWDSLPKPTGKFGLDLTGTQVTDVGLKEVAKFQRLTMLCLQLCGKITDSGFKEVAKLQQLTSVNLESSNVSDADLKELAQLRQLAQFSLFLWQTNYRRGSQGAGPAQQATFARFEELQASHRCGFGGIEEGIPQMQIQMMSLIGALIISI